MSDSYNPLERAIARLLSRAPFIKLIIKKGYSRLVYLRYKKSYEYKSDFDITRINCDQDCESFFGYFDKSPVSKSGHILVHKTNEPTDHLPQSDKVVSLTVVGPGGESEFNVETYAFNWQQGSRAHWLDEKLFIFNDFDIENQKYVSRVYSVETHEEIYCFDYAVQDSFKRDYFLSLNYERLMALRPDYGYRNKLTLSKDDLLDLENDGIWKVDFETGLSELIISIEDVCEQFPNNDLKNAIHKFNHVMISPDGKKFVFMHRYLINGQRFDRLFISNSDGSGIKLLSNNGMVSHCFWKDNKTVFGYLRGEDGRDSYWSINVDSALFTEFKNELLSQQGDGHPHVFGKFFVTDTYPDKARMQKLLLGNFETGEVKIIGEFFHGFDYAGETRCDLHPRFSTDGKSIFFDSVYSGKRALCEMEITL